MSHIRQRIADELQSACLFSEVPDQSSAVIQSDQLLRETLYSDINEVASDFDSHSNTSDSEPESSVSNKYSCYIENTSQLPCTVHSFSDSELENSYLPKLWSKLTSELRSVLPPNESYTYIIQNFETLDQHSFSGAPATNFKAEFRVNLTAEDQAREWIDLLFKHCKCTYRVTRTYKPSLKRVTFKMDMHCQHFRKTLTPKQLSQKKTKPQTMVSGIRCKKTHCPSTLNITVQKPPRGKASNRHHTHQTIVKMTFHHNHPIDSAHVLGFRPVSENTKEEYIHLFSLGHSASSAHHHYEEEVMQKPDQCIIADSAVNPGIQWVHRFYGKWRSQSLGPENGKELFDHLEQEVHTYNKSNNKIGGKAKMQWDVDSDHSDIPPDSEDDDGSNDDDHPPKSKRKKKQVTQTKRFVLAICTPLMARVHENVMQSAELVFCDATSSLDRNNCSLFILSTAHPAGGLPLGVVVTSDESEKTITKGLQMLMEMVPSGAFYHKGKKKGPLLIMTDDSTTEKAAFKSLWPQAKQLLCIFHFLQRRWTWLYEGKNHILHSNRATLLKLVKALVYARSDRDLQLEYKKFLAHPVVRKYPNFLKHIQALWPRRQEWALAYRSSIPVRGNNTNNLSEAGIRILKEIVFSRVKAYNLVEMFQFVIEKMECYYQRKLLSVAHNRIDRYIQLKFRGIGAGKIRKGHIVQLSSDSDMFLVKSRRDPDSEYQVDMGLGTCTCIRGADGSPCSHQLAVALHFRKASLNCIPTLHPSSRRLLAYIALGKEANSDITFYASVAQCLDETVQTGSVNKAKYANEILPEISAELRARITQDSEDMEIAEAETDQSDIIDPALLSVQLDSVIADLKLRLGEADPQLQTGVRKFIERYNKMKSQSTALIASSFHCFGSVPRGTVTRIQGGGIRRGRRIPVQATASGRRKYGSKGKAPAPPGRKLKNKVKERPQPSQTRFILPIRNKAKGKRRHDLALSIQTGTQNAGKW